MATITPNKTPNVAVLTHAAVTHPTTIVGSAINVATKRAALIFMWHGYIEAAADTNPGKFKVQVTSDPGGSETSEHWVTVAEYLAQGTTPPSEAMTATEAAAETVLAVASTTGFAAEDLVYIQDTTTLAASEWNEIQEIVSNTSIDILSPGLVTQKDNADVIFGDASAVVCALNLEGVEAFRVIWSHEGATGANGHVKAEAVTYDSDTSA